MNRIKLAAGKYRAVTPVVLSHFQGNQHRTWKEIEAGREFEVPQSINGFGYFLTYHPDFDDAEPQAERIGA